jgi:hypothetical protein
MWKKIAAAGAVGAAVLGGGGAALAASGSTSSTATPAPSSSSTSAPTAKAAHRTPLQRALHAQWVTRKGKAGFVTHDTIRGEITSVSPTSITVKAADNTSQTYQVTSSTVIKLRPAGKGAKAASASIGQLKSGEKAVVLGTGSSTLTATRIGAKAS